jgi:hypothetical protein
VSLQSANVAIRVKPLYRTVARYLKTFALSIAEKDNWLSGPYICLSAEDRGLCSQLLRCKGRCQPVGSRQSAFFSEVVNPRIFAAPR